MIGVRIVTDSPNQSQLLLWLYPLISPKPVLPDEETSSLDISPLLLLKQKYLEMLVVWLVNIFSVFKITGWLLAIYF